MKKFLCLIIASFIIGGCANKALRHSVQEQCFQLGYSAFKLDHDKNGYCLKTVNGTTTITPLSELVGKK